MSVASTAKESLVKAALIVTSLVVLGGSLGVISASSASRRAPSPWGRRRSDRHDHHLDPRHATDTTPPAHRRRSRSGSRGARSSCSVRRTHEATPRVATAAIEALLEGPTRAEAGVRLPERDPRRHASARDLDRRRSRDDRPHVGVPVRRRLPVDAGPPRSGRLHADAVPDRAGRSASGSTARR